MLVLAKLSRMCNLHNKPRLKFRIHNYLQGFQWKFVFSGRHTSTKPAKARIYKDMNIFQEGAMKKAILGVDSWRGFYDRSRRNIQNFHFHTIKVLSFKLLSVFGSWRTFVWIFWFLLESRSPGGIDEIFTILRCVPLPSHQDYMFSSLQSFLNRFCGKLYEDANQFVLEWK